MQYNNKHIIGSLEGKMFFGLFGENIEYKPKHKKLLQNLKIDDTHPDTLLHDFHAMVEVFREKEQTLTPGSQIPLKLLEIINQRMKNPVDIRLKRPQQKSYPRIEGLYLILRASGLTRVDESGKKPKLLVDEDWLKQWQEFNPTERYCYLLESWLLRGREEILGQQQTAMERLPRNFSKIAIGFKRFSASGLKIKDYADFKQNFSFYPETYNLGLMDLFGIVKVSEGKPKDGEGWQVTKVERTDFGEALLAVLAKEFFADPDRFLAYDFGQDTNFSALKPYLQEYFPQWQKTMEIKIPEPKKGAYIFKVRLYDIWSAKLAIDSTRTFEELAETIISAVGFDNDHLYSFTLKNRFGGTFEIGHSYMEDMYSSAEILLEKANLRIGSKIEFVFDFGDNWEFDLMLESINPDEVGKVTRILETKGEAPEQYPNWDEDGDDDFDSFAIGLDFED